MTPRTPRDRPDARLDDLTAGIDPISLEELDRRAALQRRTDQKYLLRREGLEEILRELAGDHQALEIDGRRRFAYESVYFDTPDLRCFFDHVRDRHPRFKVRTRLYVDSARCEVEVKMSRAKDDTEKHSVGQDRADCGSITADGERLVSEVVDLDAPAELRRVLRTEFSRMTLAAVDDPERVTIDLAIGLTGVSGGRAQLLDDHALIESKTRDGDGRCDRILREHGIEPVTLSKYRLGVALLERPDADRDYAAKRAPYFRLAT